MSKGLQTWICKMEHLILLHGALGSSTQFDSLKNLLKDHFNVHSINFSGHGGARMPDEEFSIPLFAAEVKTYLEENKIQSASFFGYSMGGYVAMYLAKHQSSLVNKVITLATKFYWDEEVANREIKMLDAEKITEKLPAFAEQLKQRHTPNHWETVLFKTKVMLLALGKQNTLQIEEYRSISNDCLLLIGDNDKMVSLDETTAVSDALPNAQIKILPDTPHALEQVNVSLLAGIILHFINSNKENPELT